MKEGRGRDECGGGGGGRGDGRRGRGRRGGKGGERECFRVIRFEK